MAAVTRAILFDFYGTLAHAESWGPTHEEVLARFGYSVDDAARDAWRAEVVDGTEHAEHSIDRDTYVAWERARLARMARACGVGDDDVDALVDDLYSATKSFVLRPFPEVGQVVGALRDAGIVVAVCSNWDWDIDKALAAAGIEALFDVVVTSARAGARKPHPRIYQHTLSEIAVDGSDALFVGDSWECDVAGPLSFGIARALHVCRDRDGATADSWPALVPGAHRAPTLDAVLDLVGLAAGSSSRHSVN